MTNTNTTSPSSSHHMSGVFLPTNLGMLSSIAACGHPLIR